MDSPNLYYFLPYEPMMGFDLRRKPITMKQYIKWKWSVDQCIRETVYG